ncbi:hypothetical protein TcasGA2_TC007827 [Tribolium castaneum]|uniref:HMG box domain-containing protein n=1 Tax=Tribolium castaneum TaxID=7070 RepID=D2A2C4_TRICA|nr:hypothetical protein TcasGA2_TC007827 [Tribolium castaneum]
MVKPEKLCMDDFDEVPAPKRSLSKCQESKQTRAKISRNPFINFIFDFWKSNPTMNSREVFSRAGEKWRNMSPEEKSPYREMAKRAPKKRRRC